MYNGLHVILQCISSSSLIIYFFVTHQVADLKSIAKRQAGRNNCKLVNYLDSVNIIIVAFSFLLHRQWRQAASP